MHFSLNLVIDGRGSDLDSWLSKEEPPKTLLSVYKELFKKTLPAVTKCREKWATEVPDIQGEDWDHMLDQPFQYLVSTRHKLIQFKFLHRIYYTPARRFQQNADIVHTHRWMQIKYFGPVNKSWIFGWKWWHASMYSSLFPLKCRLGFVYWVWGRKWFHPGLKERCSILFFYTREAILLHWKKLAAPTLSFWKGQLNGTILQSNLSVAHLVISNLHWHNKEWTTCTVIVICSPWLVLGIGLLLLFVCI